MSQYETALHNLAPALVDYFASGRVAGPAGNRSERYAPHGAYRCADLGGHERWLALAVANEEEWHALLAALGQSADDSRFATMAARMENRAALDEFVGALVRERDADALTVALQAAGVSAYPVQNCVDIHRDDNLESFGFWQWLDHKVMGPSPYEGIAHRLERTPGELRTPAPTIGQHNDEVFGKMLGLDPAEIARLKEERVIF
jgi:benzylsuccinate CoA-transferase BbsF subunit